MSEREKEKERATKKHWSTTVYTNIKLLSFNVHTVLANNIRTSHPIQRKRVYTLARILVVCILFIHPLWLFYSFCHCVCLRVCFFTRKWFSCLFISSHAHLISLIIMYMYILKNKVNPERKKTQKHSPCYTEYRLWRSSISNLSVSLSFRMYSAKCSWWERLSDEQIMRSRLSFMYWLSH